MEKLLALIIVATFSACGPSSKPNGILLSGIPENKASEAVFDYELERAKDEIPEDELCIVKKKPPTEDPYCIDIDNRVVLTKFEIAFAQNTTIDQINTMLLQINARITSMVRGTNLLIVRILRPKNGLPEFLDIIKRAESESFVLYVTKAYIYTAQSLIYPENDYLEGELLRNQVKFNDHHLAIHAHAAWNAKTALHYKSSAPPLIIVMDFFGDGIPNNDFAFNYNPQDFSSDNPLSHGYHILGTLGGRHQENNTRRGVVRGIYPDTLDLRVIDLSSGLDSLTATHRLIKIIRNETNRNIILNTSLESGCRPTISTTEPSDCMTRMLPYVRRWLQLVRGWEIYKTGESGANQDHRFNLENKILHITAAGNATSVPGKIPDEYDATLASPYAAARLRQDLTTFNDVVLKPSENTLVIENRINSSGYTPDGVEKETYAPGDLLQNCPIREACDIVAGCNVFYPASKYSGDLSAIGTEVWSMKGSNWCAGNYSGSSMSTSQVSGLAAYVWALKPALTPQELMSLLFRTADDTVYSENAFAPINCRSPMQNPKPVIDAYAALLAVDNSSALTENGSPLDAPVRLAILDINGENGFDEQDLLTFLDHFDIAQGNIDYNSRYDLNGDGRIGGNHTAKFNLDIDEQLEYDTSIEVEINGAVREFDEESTTDFDILNYYANSPLYSGDKMIRDFSLTDRMIQN